MTKETLKKRPHINDYYTTVQLLNCDPVHIRDWSSYYKDLEKYIDILENDTSRNRNLLIEFHNWLQNMWVSPNAEITENVIDVFLKNQQT